MISHPYQPSIPDKPSSLHWFTSKSIEIDDEKQDLNKLM